MIARLERAQNEKSRSMSTCTAHRGSRFPRGGVSPAAVRRVDHEYDEEEVDDEGDDEDDNETWSTRNCRRRFAVDRSLSPSDGMWVPLSGRYPR